MSARTRVRVGLAFLFVGLALADRSFATWRNHLVATRINPSGAAEVYFSAPGAARLVRLPVLKAMAVSGLTMLLISTVLLARQSEPTS